MTCESEGSSVDHVCLVSVQERAGKLLCHSPNCFGDTEIPLLFSSLLFVGPSSDLEA